MLHVVKLITLVVAYSKEHHKHWSEISNMVINVGIIGDLIKDFIALCY